MSLITLFIRSNTSQLIISFVLITQRSLHVCHFYNMVGLVSVRAITFFLFLSPFLCSGILAAGGDSEGEMKPPIVGGIREIPVDSPEVTRLAKVITDKLTEGDSKQRTVVEVVKAGVQVVSGTLTHLTLKISDGQEEVLYEASIWEQPWLNKTEITKLEPVTNN